MNTTADRVRQCLPLGPTTETLLSRGLLYSGTSGSVAVVAESQAFEWCDHYLAPFVTSKPLCANGMRDFVLCAVHDGALWQGVQLAIADLACTSSQTYNGTAIREWILDAGLYVQQYVERKSFTIIDAERRCIAFVDDCASDTEWWMEPARLVREMITRRIEEDSHFVFHAASVAIGDCGVALVGPKRAGKTTLTVAALEYASAAFIANDRTYFEMVDGTPYVHGWPVTSALGIGTCLASPALRPLLESGIRSRYPQPALDGRLDLGEFRRRDVSAMIQERVKVELTPLEVGETFGVPVIRRSKLSAVVLPKLDPSCSKPQLRDVAPFEAAEVLGEQALTCDHVNYPDWLHLRRRSDEETGRRVAAFVEQLVLAVPAYEMRYWEGKSAAQALRSALTALKPLV
jgi:hypothetical protein